MTEETFRAQLEQAQPWAVAVGLTPDEVSDLFKVILAEMDVTCLRDISAVNRRPCLRRFAALVEERTGDIH